MRRLVTTAATAVLLATLGGAVPAQAITYSSITGSGSSASANVLDQWTSDVRRELGMPVSYSSSGSTAGRADFRNGTVDFAVTDVPYGLTDASGLLDPPPTRPFGYIPLVAGGTALAYHLTIDDRRVTDLNLSGAAVVGIFTRAITVWNDPVIAQDNPGLVLPATPIVPVVRSDGAGTTYQLTRYFSSEFPSQWDAPTSYFPSEPGIISQSGSLGVAAYVASPGAEGSITYVENSYALRLALPVANLGNAAGSFVPPSAQAITVALDAAVLQSDLTHDLDGVYANPDSRAYPLSSFSYAVVPTGEGGPFVVKGLTLGDFFYYALCQGQQRAEPLGYAPLPRALVEDGFAQVAKIPGVQLRTFDPTTCPVIDVAEPAPAGELLVAERKDRSAPVALDGSVQQGNVFVFAEAPAGSEPSAVTFLVDGRKLRVERNAPYDLNGGTASTARPYNVSRRLGAGEHTVTAVFAISTGTVTATATFSVVGATASSTS